MSPPLTSYGVGEAGVALLRIERSEARNAINTPVLEELLPHLAAAREDPDVRALVISSNDPTALSAGADVREELDEASRVRRMELFAGLYDTVVGFPRATVAACHGACVGAGAELAVACDLRVAGDNMALRFPGTALGLPVGPARLLTLCGLSVAKDLLLTSRTVGAEEAHRWGLVHRVASAAETESAAIALAAEVAAHDPASVERIKALLHAHDGVVERTREEGEGQVDWQRSGPGFPFRALPGP